MTTTTMTHADDLSAAAALLEQADYLTETADLLEPGSADRRDMIADARHKLDDAEALLTQNAAAWGYPRLWPSDAETIADARHKLDALAAPTARVGVDPERVRAHVAETAALDAVFEILGDLEAAAAERRSAAADPAAFQDYAALNPDGAPMTTPTITPTLARPLPSVARAALQRLLECDPDYHRFGALTQQMGVEISRYDDAELVERAYGTCSYYNLWRVEGALRRCVTDANERGDDALSDEVRSADARWLRTTVQRATEGGL